MAHLIPYSHYKQTLERLKLEHPKARHFVVAWRYINEHDQIVEHCSDDGEPKGTSGKPTLAVLAGNDLVNSAIIIVRYFGGTKLGTGGLVRAYSQACNDVIDESTLDVYVKLQSYSFHTQYADISLIEYQLEENNVTTVKKEFDEMGARFHVESEKASWENFYAHNHRCLHLY